MILNLTDLSDEPLQAQIARQIRAKILAGDVSTGDSLPSIRGLAKSNKVSVITVQRAYDSLFREGLIHSRRGKGFFVSELSTTTKRKLAEQRLTESLKAPFAAALDEGLTEEDIQQVVATVLVNNEGA